MSDAAKRTARTVLQSAVGIAVVLPAIVDASGLPETLPWVAGALAVAAWSHPGDGPRRGAEPAAVLAPQHPGRRRCR